MQLWPQPALDSRIAEALMFALAPCDLGDGIEVIHDVEAIEIEMDCDLDDDAYSAPYETIELSGDVELGSVWDTLPFDRLP